MWQTLLKTVRFGDLKQVLSPRFFRVFSAGKIVGVIRELLSNYRDAKRFQKVLDRRSESIAKLDFDLMLDPDANFDREGKDYDGQYLLVLYFHQFFDSTESIIDIGPERFGTKDGKLVWAPRRVYIKWDDEFLEGIRKMYSGFYGEDDVLFEKGLATLNLQGMGDLFRKHFGNGKQHVVTFDVEKFHDTFEEILLRCKAENRSLHPNFGPLGIYLGALYNHLDSLGGSYDVRAAFERATAASDNDLDFV